MLPSQILLNNLLYDSSQLAIPTDNVDPEQLARPSRWDVGFIRRFMLFFGPVSSVFDFVTFGVMLWIFHAGEPLFQAGWFVESLATQALVIFAIRTRRIPLFRSTPASRCCSPPSAPSPSARCCRPPRSPAPWASSHCQVPSTSPWRSWSPATWPSSKSGNADSTAPRPPPR